VQKEDRKKRNEKEKKEIGKRKERKGEKELGTPYHGKYVWNLDLIGAIKRQIVKVYSAYVLL
jgi:hypothetical protein